MNNDQAKEIATGFFRWWHNAPGTNTDQGFDAWWAANKDRFLDSTDTPRYYLFSYAFPGGGGTLCVECHGPGYFPDKRFLLRKIADNCQTMTMDIHITGWSEFPDKAVFDSYRNGEPWVTS